MSLISALPLAAIDSSLDCPDDTWPSELSQIMAHALDYQQLTC
jgi:hypothetical protein